MNEIVINELATELNIKKEQIKAVLQLLSEGSTIPFIARYRKEATGALDENQIEKINEKYTYYNNLMERKEKNKSNRSYKNGIRTFSKTNNVFSN